MIEMLKNIFSFRRCAIASGILLTLFVVFKLKNRQDKKWFYYEAPCTYPEDQRTDTIELAAIVNRVLDREVIAHTLCYGSLWGALREKDMLPYDPDVEFCVYNEDLGKVDEQYFYRIFRKEGVGISYGAYDGVYSLTYGKATGELVLFELSDDFIYLQRVGASRLLQEEDRERFPSKMMAPPLPKLKFNKLDLPVPVGGIDIQKYFYPEDWWKEVPPKGCDNKVVKG